MRATPIGGPAGSDNRWQGYTHQELYDMLHAGPGTRAAGLTADTWSGLSGALADIQQDISLGVTQSGASWIGAAADSARDALGPLGDWAQQASAAAELMQLSTTMQGELLDKARTEMPVPIPAAQPGDITPMRQLMSAQLDAEQVEAAHDAAAQRAFQVMTDYESGTTDNTSTLGEFGTPPQLVVDTSPITGIPLSRTSEDGMVERGRTFRTARPVPRLRPSGLIEEEPAHDTPATVRSAATTEEPATESVHEPTAETAQPTVETTETAGPTTASAGTATTTPPERVITGAPAATPEPANPVPVSNSPAPRRTTHEDRDTPENRPAHHDNPEPRTTTTNTPPGQQNQPASNSTTPSAATTPEAGHPAPVPAPGQPAAAAPLVPSSRGARLVEDEVLQPNVLILGEDIYGRQTYTEPVIGE